MCSFCLAQVFISSRRILLLECSLQNYLDLYLPNKKIVKSWPPEIWQILNYMILFLLRSSPCTTASMRMWISTLAEKSWCNMASKSLPKRRGLRLDGGCDDVDVWGYRCLSFLFVSCCLGLGACLTFVAMTDFLFLFISHCSWPWQVSKVLPGKKVKLELTCFRDRTDCRGGTAGHSKLSQHHWRTEDVCDMLGSPMTSWNIEFSFILQMESLYESYSWSGPPFWPTSLYWQNQERRRGKARNNLGHPCAWWTLLWGSEGMEFMSTGAAYVDRHIVVPLTATTWSIQYLRSMLWRFKGELPFYDIASPRRNGFVEVPQLLNRWEKTGMLLLLGNWCLEHNVSRVRPWISFWKLSFSWKEPAPTMGKGEVGERVCATGFGIVGCHDRFWSCSSGTSEENYNEVADSASLIFCCVQFCFCWHFCTSFLDDWMM